MLSCSLLGMLTLNARFSPLASTFFVCLPTWPCSCHGQGLWLRPSHLSPGAAPRFFMLTPAGTTATDTHLQCFSFAQSVLNQDQKQQQRHRRGRNKTKKKSTRRLRSKDLTASHCTTSLFAARQLPLSLVASCSKPKPKLATITSARQRPRHRQRQSNRYSVLAALLTKRQLPQLRNRPLQLL